MMPPTHDQETIRRYLLGQLTDAEEAATEQRLLIDDYLFEELEISKEELVEEYLSKELTERESEWFEQSFLVSPEGKQRKAFAKALDRYVSAHRLAPEKKLKLTERLLAFANSRHNLLRAAALAVVVVVVGIFWWSRDPPPKSFANLTLASSSSTRSSGIDLPKVNLKEDALRLTLLLPTPAAPGARYRVELLNDKGETRTSEVDGQAQSVVVEIPKPQLTRGQYAVTLSTISGNGVQRLPDSYYFNIE